MHERTENEAAPMKNHTTVEQRSERELVVTRTVNGPVRLVFEAWTKADLFRRWWVPKSYGLTLLACEMDVRVGGQYRLVFRHEDATMEFFGTYLEVTPNSRLVWDQRGRRRRQDHHDGDLRGQRRQDVAGRARSLSLERSA